MAAEWQPKQIKLNEKGLAKILGEREAEVMDVVWKKNEVSVRDVCGELCEKREYSFNTIMTIMNRLTTKGLLKKEAKEGVYCYEAVLSRKDFILKRTAKLKRKETEPSKRVAFEQKSDRHDDDSILRNSEDGGS